MFTYKTAGVCARDINIEIKENKIENIEFIGGCNGNLSGIGQLVKGMDVDDVISKLKGVDCKGRGTSCPDQLSKALLEWKKEN